MSALETPVYDEVLLESLDFQPDVACEKIQHKDDPTPAQFWIQWTCGCIMAVCTFHAEEDRADSADPKLTVYCSECGVDPIFIGDIWLVK